MAQHTPERAQETRLSSIYTTDELPEHKFVDIIEGVSPEDFNPLETPKLPRHVRWAVPDPSPAFDDDAYSIDFGCPESTKNEEQAAAVSVSWKEGGLKFKLAFAGQFEKIIRRESKRPIPPYTEMVVSDKQKSCVA